MTSRNDPGWFQISHPERAQLARQQPGKWTYLRAYAALHTATDTASSIRCGTYAAWQPPGAFQARIVQGPDTWPHRPWTVYVRYTGSN